MSIIGNKVDSVIYGNPVKYQSELLSEIYYLDTIYEPLQQYDFPTNSSNKTKAELTALAARLRAFSEDGAKMQTALAIHFGFDDFWKNTLGARGVLLDHETYVELMKDVENIVTKIKYYYQRARPFQLAAYYNLALFPETTTGVESPSYPSLSYIKSLIISHVFSNAHSFSLFGQLVTEVKESRLNLGFNYDSDMEFSKIVFNSIIRNKGFEKKYELEIA